MILRTLYRIAIQQIRYCTECFKIKPPFAALHKNKKSTSYRNLKQAFIKVFLQNV